MAELPNLRVRCEHGLFVGECPEAHPWLAGGKERHRRDVAAYAEAARSWAVLSESQRTALRNRLASRFATMQALHGLGLVEAVDPPKKVQRSKLHYYALRLTPRGLRVVDFDARQRGAAPESDPCPMCGREVKRRKSAGALHNKRRVRHKCPHGLWCAQGEASWGSHSNGRPPPRQQKCCGARGARGEEVSDAT